MTHFGVLGATSKTGIQLLRMLGSDPTATVTALRRRGKPSAAGLPATWIDGDATDPGAVRAVVDGADAVISLVAAPPSEPVGTVRSTATRTLLEAAAAVQSRPAILVVSALGGSLSRRQQTAPARWVYARAVGSERFAEVDRQESILIDSGIPATVVRPPKLDDRPGSGYRETSQRVGVVARMSRADLAQCLADMAAEGRPDALRFATVVSR
jgi:uncharacterized protein YbjT (DUF2867 family)